MIDLRHGDCLEVMKELEDGSVDCVVTSPPYNFNMNYGRYKDNLSYDSYLEIMNDVFKEIRRLLSPKGHFFLNVGFNSKNPWLAMDIASLLRSDFILRDNICWVKAIQENEQVRGHSQVTPSKRHLMKSWEHVFHFVLDDSVLLSENSHIPLNEKYREVNKKRYGKDTRKPIDSWFVPYETIGCWGNKTKKDTKANHPAIYPEKLVEMCLDMCDDVDMVLDPFVGTGTTAVVCSKRKIDCIGIDIDEEYLSLAKERITSVG